MNRLNSYLFISTLFVLLSYSCANPVTPTGGKKDTTPPKVLSSIPENNSVNFTGKKIILNFSEYVQVDNAFQKGSNKSAFRPIS